MLCCLLCLTVCVVPAFANDIEGLFLHDGTFGYLAHNGDLTTPAFEPFNNMSATFSYSSNSLITPFEGYTILSIMGDVLNTGVTDLVAVYPNDIYFEVIFPVGKGDLSISNSNIVTAMNYFYPPVISPCDADGNLIGAAPLTNYVVELLIDDSVFASKSISGNPGGFPDSFNYSGPVNARFSLRYHVHNPDSSSITINFNGANYFRSEVDIPYDIFTFNGESVPVDNLEVVISKLDDISGKLDTIESHAVSIDNNLSEVKNGLSDSNSSIWGAFKDSVSGLFVPSSGDLESVKNGFDQLAQDKLGGAYQTVDLVDNGVKSVVDKFKNPGTSPGVEFPGISVPLGGDVGTVTLAASQTVTIPEEITSALYPVAGVFIPIICVIWTIRQCTDMVECFMSGMSYAEFLHRNLDKEDEEV